MSQTTTQSPDRQRAYAAALRDLDRAVEAQRQTVEAEAASMSEGF